MLRSGSKYNTYFRESSCTPSYLGTSDTAFTVSKMKEWAYKNASQTKKLALGEFTGMPLHITVQKVHDFLYNHIQYELDGARQNLKSPACAWATRTEGTDCKSYSIFASTILINLGIKHYFRRVRQPGDNEDKWTHVYVIVPADQKNLKPQATGNYYVLDATVHDNKEVRIIEKRDTLMEKVSLEHYGLHAPKVHKHGLAGCSCTPKPKPAPAPVVVRNPLPQPDINNGGVINPRTTPPIATRSNTTVTATPRVTTSTSPVLREAVNEAVRSNSSSTRSTTSTRSTGGSSSVLRMAPTEALRSPNGWGMKCPHPVGMGYVATPTLESAQTSDYGGGGSGNNLSKGSNLVNAAGQTLGTISQGGASAGTIVKSAAGILPIAFATGPAAPFVLAGAAILALIPNKFFDKVVGQFFSNRLRTDCIRSSRSPSTSKKQLQRDIPLIQTEAQKMIQSFQSRNIAQIEGAVNMFMEFFYSVDAKGRWWLNNGARDCTRDGIIVSTKGLDEAKKEIIKIAADTIKQYGGILKQVGTRKVSYPADKSINKPETTFDVEQYKVEIDPSVAAQQNQLLMAQQAQQSNSFTPNTLMLMAQQAQQSNSFTPNTLKATGSGVSMAGFGGNALVILAAIAAGTFIYSKQ